MREIVVPTFVLMPQPVPEALGQLVAAGVRLIEVHGDAPETHIDLTDEVAVGALAEAIDRLPLEVHSVHAPFSQPNEPAWDIAQPDEGMRAQALSSLAKVIRLSARLGAEHVVVHIGVDNHRRGLLAHGRASLAQLAVVAREAGVRIAVENMPPRYLGGCLADIQSVLDGLDPEGVGFCLDTGHAMMGDDDPCEYARALRDRLWAVHWHASNGNDDSHLFPSSSATRWDDFVAALDEVGYTSPVTVEAVPPASASLRWAVQAAHAILLGESAPGPA
jgi:sugar phosphate isomerase/epimerase